jgi:hypothetical protein
MSFDIVIRKQDTLPLISRKIYLNGAPVNLTGYAMRFVVVNITGVQLFSNIATMVASTDNNEVQYQWTNTDSAAAAAGVWFAYFEGTKSGDKLTFPNNRPLSLIVTDTASWEYSYSGDPSKRPIDKVRFLLGDKNMSAALFTDSEILFVLSEFGSNAYFAASDLAATQAGSYSSIADKTVGPLSIRYGEQSNRWTALAKTLRTRGAGQSGAKALFTGNKRDPMFRIGMNDMPESELPILGGGL